MSFQSATIKDVPVNQVKNFESTCILFTFLSQRLFLATDHEFLLREPRFILRNIEIDRIDISCNTEGLMKQLELNVLNQTILQLKFNYKPNSLFQPNAIIRVSYQIKFNM